MDQTVINLINGISSGLLLFMLSSGLTLIFSMMGVLNFAHASFYMLGAYFAYTLTSLLGFTAALILAPVLVGLAGALFERSFLRRVHRLGHVAELLVTFGLSYVIIELVQLAWGRVAVPFRPPSWLQGPAFTIAQSQAEGLRAFLGSAPADVCKAAACIAYPATRGFMMIVALLMLLSLWLLLTRTRIGLVIRASLTHPEAAQALGHNVPFLFMLVFGSGCALAGLAGVIGGITFVTEPSMASIVGSIIFVVVVVGGMGSLIGAFVGSMLIGLLQTLPLSIDSSLLTWAARHGVTIAPDHPAYSLLRLTPAQVAPILPYLLLVLMLIIRPKGLLGTRES